MTRAVIGSNSILKAEAIKEQAQRGQVLTRLAILYAPLSFVASIFGMSVKEINGSPLPIWFSVAPISSVGAARSTAREVQCTATNSIHTTAIFIDGALMLSLTNSLCRSIFTMADGLSIAASALEVVELAFNIVQMLRKYIKSVGNAVNEINDPSNDVLLGVQMQTLEVGWSYHPGLVWQMIC